MILEAKMDIRNKEVCLANHTYFVKDIQKNINDVNVGDIVFIKIRSPLHYGNKEWTFYGKIQKMTAKYFWITEYVEASWGTAIYCDTDTIVNHDAKFERYTKQWAKTRLIEIWSARTMQKVDEVVIYNPR